METLPIFAMAAGAVAAVLLGPCLLDHTARVRRAAAVRNRLRAGSEDHRGRGAESCAGDAYASTCSRGRFARDKGHHGCDRGDTSRANLPLRAFISCARLAGAALSGRRRRFDGQEVAEAGARIAEAGLSGRVEPEELIALVHRAPPFEGALVGIVLLPIGASAALAGVVATFVTARVLPERLLARWAEGRGRACERELPGMLDVLSMGVSAGLSFDAAFEVYVQRVDGVLAKECRSALSQWKSGVVLRQEALERMAERICAPNVTRFVDIVVQAMDLGSPLAEVLGSLAVEMRKQRKADSEERIAKAPVKMLVPTGMLILPAMLLVVMGPVLIELMQGFL